MTKPTEYPEWATTLDVDATSGQNNRVEPSSGLKITGWIRRVIPPRQYTNWLFWRIYEWIKYFDESFVQWISAMQVGNSLAIATGDYAPALSALNGTDVAFIDAVNEELRAYRFDGSDWAQVGNSLAIATVGAPALCALNGTDVAFIDGVNEELRAYRFDGSDWAQVGNSLAITGVGGPALCALNGTDVAFIDAVNEGLRTYRFAFYVGAGPYRP
jgi:hypothetical protein